jgi:hypothetical protein
MDPQVALQRRMEAAQKEGSRQAAIQNEKQQAAARQDAIKEEIAKAQPPPPSPSQVNELA